MYCLCSTVSSHCRCAAASSASSPVSRVDVDHSRQQIRGAYGVAFDARQLADRYAVLVVRRFVEAPGTDHPVTAIVEEEACELEMGDIPGVAIQLHQRALDLGVAGHIDAAPAAEDGIDAAHGTFSDVQQRVLTGGTRHRDAGLHEVADAIQLVAVREVRPTRGRVGDLHVRVDVAVRHLRCSHDRDDLVDALAKVRAG